MQTNIRLVSGNKIPVMGLGTWQLAQDTAGTVLYAIKLGYRMFDTSSDYKTQSGIGRAIRASKMERKEFFVVSKVEETDNSYERTLSNLKELGMDYLDLVLIHRPPPSGAGINLWKGLIRAKEEGLVRDIGVSNYPALFIEDLIDETGYVPAVNQLEWSPFGHSDEMRRYCMDKKIVIMAYSPLTHGRRLDDPVLNEVAEQYDKTAAQLLIHWNIQTGTIPIPKANSKEHLMENKNVFDFDIKGEDLRSLEQLNHRYSSLGRLPYL